MQLKLGNGHQLISQLWYLKHQLTWFIKIHLQNRFLFEKCWKSNNQSNQLQGILFWLIYFHNQRLRVRCHPIIHQLIFYWVNNFMKLKWTFWTLQELHQVQIYCHRKIWSYRNYWIQKQYKWWWHYILIQKLFLRLLLYIKVRVNCLMKGLIRILWKELGIHMIFRNNKF